MYLQKSMKTSEKTNEHFSKNFENSGAINEHLWKINENHTQIEDTHRTIEENHWNIEENHEQAKKTIEQLKKTMEQLKNTMEKIKTTIEKSMNTIDKSDKSMKVMEKSMKTREHSIITMEKKHETSGETDEQCEWDILATTCSKWEILAANTKEGSLDDQKKTKKTNKLNSAPDITKGSVSYLSSPCFSTIIGGIGGPARGKRRILDVMY